MNTVPYLEAVSGASRFLTPTDGAVALGALLAAATVPGEIPEGTVAIKVAVPNPSDVLFYTEDDSTAVVNECNPFTGLPPMTLRALSAQLARLKFIGASFYVTFYRNGSQDN